MSLAVHTTPPKISARPADHPRHTSAYKRSTTTGAAAIVDGTETKRNNTDNTADPIDPCEKRDAHKPLSEAELQEAVEGEAEGEVCYFLSGCSNEELHTSPKFRC